MTGRLPTRTLCRLVGPLLVIATPCLSAELTVDRMDDAVDAVPGDGLCETAPDPGCSLRAAIQEANALPGADTILVPPGIFVLSLAGIDEDEAATGDLDVTDAVSIAGAGDCDTSLAPGASCEVSVTFTPEDVGAATATLEADSAESSTASLAVEGEGVSASVVATAVELEVDPDSGTADGNGVFEPAELVTVAPAWRNDGASATELVGGQHPRPDAGVPAQGPGGPGLRASGVHRSVRRRALPVALRRLDRGPGGARHHRRLRRRQLLPGQPGEPRPDGRLPRQDLQPLAIRSIAPVTKDRLALKALARV
ncbi:MAG: hypothetical protein ACRD2Z_14000, partial [Thermoanaerobaculia bacterium]